MTQFKSDFLRVMHERGHIHQCTDLPALDEKASKGIVIGYIGYDATADSLHVGHASNIMMLRRMQQTGHKPIVLMGGGTTKVGDPSDKTGLRQMLTNEQIDANIASIKETFSHFLKFGDGPTDAVTVNNADWLDKLEYIPFLREIGTHITINRMVAFDFVKRRLEQELPLTFLEFNYMLMQAYDFVELQKRYGCVLQMGGSDQWGNIINGVELGRRIIDKELFGLTTPLLTNAAGAKMGKTAAGAVWLKKEKLSSYDYWQFWRNTEDDCVVPFLKRLTDLPLHEIARLEKLKDAEINEAKKILAFEATKLAHGEEAAQAAADTAREVFEGGGKGGELPTFEFARGTTPTIIDVIVSLGFVASRGEAKRLIEQGGIKINDIPVKNLTATVGSGDIDFTKTARLSMGKKHHALIKEV